MKQNGGPFPVNTTSTLTVAKYFQPVGWTAGWKRMGRTKTGIDTTAYKNQRFRVFA